MRFFVFFLFAVFFMSGCTSFLYNSANVSFLNKDFDDAIRYYQELIRTEEDEELIGGSLLGLAWSYFYKSEYDTATKYFAEFINKNPDNQMIPFAIYGEAKSRMMRYEYDGASRGFLKIIFTYKESNDELIYKSLMYCAECYTKLGKDDEIIALFKNYLKGKVPADKQVNIIMKLGKIYKEKELWDEAISYYQQVYKNFVSISEVSFAKLYAGECYEEKGEIDTAVLFYKEFIDEKPKSPASVDKCLWLAGYFEDQGKEDMVKMYYEKIALDHAKSKEATEALYWLATHYSRAGDAEKSFDYYRRLYEDFPASFYCIEAMEKLVDYYENRREISKSEEIMNEYIERFPGGDRYAEYLYKTGIYSYKAGAVERAEKAFKIFIEKFPQDKRIEEIGLYEIRIQKDRKDYNGVIDSVENYYSTHRTGSGAAEALIIAGDFCFSDLAEYDSAISFYMRAMESTQDTGITGYAKYRVGISYFKKNEEEKGEKVLREYFDGFQYDKNIIDAGVFLAEYYVGKERYGDGMKIVEILSKKMDYFSNERILLVSLDVNMRTGRMRESTDVYRELLKRYPDSQRLKTVEETLFDKFAESSNEDGLVMSGERLLTRDLTIERRDKVYEELFYAYEAKNDTGKILEVIKNWISANSKNDTLIVDSKIWNLKYLVSKGEIFAAKREVTAESFAYLLGGLGDTGRKREAYFIAAQLHANTGDTQSAYNNYLKCIEGDHNDQMAKKSAEEIGKYMKVVEIDTDKVEQYFKEIVEKFPDSRESIIALAEINESKGDFEKASKYYDRIIETKDTSVFSSDFLEKAAEIKLEKLADTSAALNYYELLVNMFPEKANNEDVVLKMAVCNKEVGNWEKAEKKLEEYKKVTSVKGDTVAEVNLMLGEVLANQKKWDKALDEYVQIVDKFPKNEIVDKAQFNIGKCFYEKGDYQSALIEYQKVLKNYPDRESSPESQYMIANCYLMLDNKKQARVEFAKFKRIYPDDKRTKDVEEKLKGLQ